jgi:hypothetical protein
MPDHALHHFRGLFVGLLVYRMDPPAELVLPKIVRDLVQERRQVIDREAGSLLSGADLRRDRVPLRSRRRGNSGHLKQRRGCRCRTNRTSDSGRGLP